MCSDMGAVNHHWPCESRRQRQRHVQLGAEAAATPLVGTVSCWCQLWHIRQVRCKVDDGHKVSCCDARASMICNMKRFIAAQSRVLHHSRPSVCDGLRSGHKLCAEVRAALVGVRGCHRVRALLPLLHL